MTSRPLATLLAAALASAPLAVRAEPDRRPPDGDDGDGDDAAGDFQTRFDAGIAHYQAGRYAKAADELGAAYALEPRPDVAFALAQALRQAGDCKRALELYRRLLAGDVSDARRRAIEEAMAPCGDTPDDAARIDDEPEAPPAEVAGGETPAPAARSSRGAWYGDVLGTSLVVVGLAGLGVGAAGMVLARGRYAAAEDAGSETAFADAIAEGDRWRTIGIAALVGGGVLAAAGVVRWTVVAGRDDDEADALAIGLDARGGLYVAGSF